MKDYWKEYAEFSLNVPEKFSFPLDIFDKWNADNLALFWTDGEQDRKFSFSEFKNLSSRGADALRDRERFDQASCCEGVGSCGKSS